jgi:predicted helicase
MSLDKYIKEINQKFSQTQGTKGNEMLYRSQLEELLKNTLQLKVNQINHDSTHDKGNKPDFVVSKNQVPILYVEAKDIGINLDKVENSEQMGRYFGYQNLVLTDYLEFRFYRNGIKYCEPIAIAHYKNGAITPNDNDFEILTRTLHDFTHSHREPIKSGTHLARIMGGKAQRIRDNVADMLSKSDTQQSSVFKVKDTITENLIHNLDDAKFADMYAQTLVYGLFAARYNDTTLESFSRQEARDIVPKSNPFLRSFFDHIAGSEFPPRLANIVDELCEVFTHADIEKILHDYYGKEKDNRDPIIHFYEDFLREYDPKKKMEMGVFYTPEPVVRSIVRLVDQALKTHFNLPSGLAESTKTEVEIPQENAIGRTDVTTKTLANNHKKYFLTPHKVQILDIATGTGTFLSEVINQIYPKYANQQGMWQSYVEQNLIPRLHGFELMMASYTIAHIKLGMNLHEKGAEVSNARMGVYLTNTLEESHANIQNNLFGLHEAINEESNLAYKVKTELPIMCIIGNPPYSGISENPYYTDNNVYKVEPGGAQKLQERKNWLDDDYVKFIRFSESMIAKNGEGIMAMITAHGYIDNPTFRGMRWHLRETFDDIYIIDLHGNANKKETAPNGKVDQNVFDIKTGVAIIVGVKNKQQNNKKPATVHKIDLYGKRSQKFDDLDAIELTSEAWKTLPTDCESWVVEGKGKKQYQKGFSVADLFKKYSVGFVTSNDILNISMTKAETLKKIQDIIELDEYGWRTTYKRSQDSRDWQYTFAKHDAIQNQYAEEKITQVSYRPFDNRYTLYTGNSRGLYASPQPNIMKHFLLGDNVGLVFARTQRNSNWNAVFISKFITETKLGEASTQSAVAPLYLYQDDGARVPNLDSTIWNDINTIAGETTPEDILHYIYAVFHTPAYREKFKEFLKIDFPRVPYPRGKEDFWQLVPLGKRLQELHLMSATDSAELITYYLVAGSDVVDKILFIEGKVWINETQYFDGVSDEVWNFYIGGYQPAQKWLKDRKGQKLEYEDILHYQKIIKSLAETIKTIYKLS